MTGGSLDPVIHAPGNLITHLRKLEDAGYLVSETNGSGRASRTRDGRAALDTYTNALRDLLGGLEISGAAGTGAREFRSA